jgi:hypothetical protein
VSSFLLIIQLLESRMMESIALGVTPRGGQNN